MRNWNAELGMRKGECRRAVTPSRLRAGLSEAKGLFSRLRCFASLSMTPLAQHDTGHSAFSIPHSAAACLTVMLLACGCASIRQVQARQQLRRGEECLKHDDLEAALAAFQEAAKLSPQMAVAHSNLGLIYRRMGEYEQAIGSFEIGRAHV